MEWYYAQGDQRRGPVGEAEFAALVANSTIQPATLVWREGMPAWQTYSQAFGSAAPGAPPAPPRPGDVACAECGRAFPPDEVIRHGNIYICAACKPVFLQKLKEGVSVAGGMNYAGFGIRFAAKILDVVIMAVVNISINLVTVRLMGPANALGAAMINLGLNTLLGVAYVTFFVGKFGATPGKMATKLRVVNADGSPVSYGKACARYFAELVSGLTFLIGYLMILWDDERRALHDRIVGTRVIRVGP